MTTIFFTDYAFVRAHCINLILLGVSSLAFFLGKPTGQLATLLMLLFGLALGGTEFVSVYKVIIFGITLSISYLPLIIYFIILNRDDISPWIQEVVYNRKPSEPDQEK